MNTPLHHRASTVAGRRPRRGPGLLLVYACVVWAAIGFGLAYGQADEWEEGFEQELEEEIEEALEEEIEEALEEDIEREIEEDIEREIEEDIEREIEEDIEREIEEDIEREIEEDIEREIEEDIEREIEEDIEREIEEDIEREIEEDIEREIEEDIEREIEEDIEREIEEDIEREIEEDIEREIEEDIEREIEDDIEYELEDEFEERYEEEFEERFDEELENYIDDDLEEEFADSLEDDFDRDFDEDLEDQIEQDFDDRLESDVEGGIEESVEDAIVEAIADDISSELETSLEVAEARIFTDEWLVMAEPQAIAALADEGYLFNSIDELPSLGLQLATAVAPATFEITDERTAVLNVVGEREARVDRNHLYAAGVPESATGNGLSPGAALAAVAPARLRIGMVDSRVDLSHQILREASIQTRDFASEEAAPMDHGTAVASILVGQGRGYQSLAPNSELLAASVFNADSSGRSVATTVALIRAVDWLAGEQVDVINLSLAGPPNQLLGAVLDRVSAEGILVLAAAGNGGPAAPPRYPAAHPGVIAVTAVDSNKRVYRLANRGDYIDLSAPGVNLRHAHPGGGFSASSGTSFAVPFVAVEAARGLQAGDATEVRRQLFKFAEDLGEPGRDPVYGYGLLRSLTTQQ
ncbi:MAG: S8 family serine peptidase [Pseudomonadota bacterium]